MSEIDWDHRELCADGSCNGVVGADGTCKVCGKAVPNWGDERMRGLQNEPEEPKEPDEDDELDDDEGDEDEDDEGDDDEDDADAGEAEHEGEWTERQLCDDGACVGVIGADGLCTVCGKRSAA